MRKKLFLFLLLFLIGVMKVGAEPIKIGDLYFDLDSNKNEASVASAPSGSTEYRGDVVIPPSFQYEGKTYSVKKIKYEAFSYCKDLITVSIPKSVTSIGQYAFNGCLNLQSVYITDLAAWCNISFGQYSNPLELCHKLYINGNLVDNLVIPNGVVKINDYTFNGIDCSAITIPESVTTIGSAAFSNSTLKSISISNSVTSIGRDAFENCAQLQSISIPQSVTTIRDYAFSGCSQLQSVNITDLTAWCNIAFGNYDSNPLALGHKLYINGSLVENLVIPNGVTKINDYTFNGIDCSAITIPESVTTIGSHAFSNSTLKSISIPNSVTSIEGYTFDNCLQLQSISIPNSVTSIGGYAFNNCKQLQSISIPNSVTSIGGYAFNNCIQLQSISLPNSVTHIAGNTFNNCSQLQSISIPNGVITIGEKAFSGCSQLQSITIPNSVTTIGGYAFSGCSQLQSVNITDLTAWCNIAFESDYSNPLASGHKLYINGSLVDNLVIPNGVKYIYQYGFCGIDCSSVTIPMSVTYIGDNAFSSAYSIKDVYVESRNPITLDYNVFPLDYPIYQGYDEETYYFDATLHVPVGCYTVYKESAWDCFLNIKENVPESIEMSPFTYQPKRPTGDLILKSLDETFSGAVTIPQHITYNDYQWGIGTIASQAFLGRKGVTSLTLNSKISSIGTNALSNMIALESIIVPSENDNFKSIDGVLFDKYNMLIQYPIAKVGTSYIVPEQTETIGRDAFFNSNLTEIILPPTLKTLYYDAFGYCRNLSSITLPSSLTSIGDYAFDHCSKLETINIPTSVSTIGQNAFNGCTKLSSIESYCYPREISDNTFPDIVYETAVLHVPIHAQYAYQDAAGWKRFKNIVGDLEGGYDYISFEDSEVRRICIANWDTNGDSKLDINEASSVTTLGTLFKGNTTITSFKELVYFTGLTKIDDNAFRGCRKLISITIPANVVEIGEYALYGCSKLTRVILPEGLQTISNYGIGACTALISIDLPSSVTTIKTRAFYNDQKLASINLPASVTTIGSYAFSSCPQLMDVTANMKFPCDIESNVFSTYSGATLHVPYGRINVYKSTNYWSSFVNVEEMEDEGGQSDLPEEFEISPITYRVIGYQTITVKSVDKTYSGSLALPSEVTAYNVSNLKVIGIDDNAMLSCNNITSLTIPATIKSIGINALSGMSTLEQINVESDNQYFTSIDGVLFTKDQKNLLQVPIAKATQYEVPSGTTTIDRDALFRSNLTSIILPSTLTTIKYDAFGYSKSLKEIALPSSVREIEEFAFDHCTSLNSVNLPPVAVLPNYMFNYCTALTSIILPSSLQAIGEKAFNGCSALGVVICKMTNPATLPDNAFPASVYENAVLRVPQNTLSIYKAAAGWSKFQNIVEDEIIDFSDANVKAICVANWDTNGDGDLDKSEAAAVTSLGSAFTGNTTIKFFDELKYFTGLTKIDDNAFKGCKLLKSIIVPANVKQIGKSAFYGDYALTNIVLPEGLEVINDYAIGACTKLTEIELPSTLTTIKTKAFYYDKLLASITIPASVTTIGTYAFASCPVLMNVTANMTSPCAIASNVFTTETYSKATLTVPYGTYDIYKTTNYWSKFVNIKSLIGHVSMNAAPISIVAGENGNMILTLEQNPPTVSFQFDLTLANGITLQKASIIPSSDLVVSAANRGYNKWRILAYSPTGTPIESNVGNLISLDINVEELLAAGDRSVTISNIILTSPDGDNLVRYSLDAVNTTITVVDAAVTDAGKGDVNLDGAVNVQDIVVLINYIIGGSSPKKFSSANADANGDGFVDVTDVSTIVLLCMPATSSNPAPAHAPAASLASMTWDTSNGLSLTIDDATSYVAAQMDVIVDGSLQVNSITAANGHTPVWQQIGENRYRILVFSNSNDTFSAFGPHLFFDVQGEGEVILSNALLVDAAGDGFNAAASSTGFTTGITTIATELSAPADVYSISGQLVRRQVTSLKDLPAGIYIVNGEKKTIK